MPTHNRLTQLRVCLMCSGNDHDWYVRVSCQVFNELSDYTYLANSIKEIIAKGSPGFASPACEEGDCS